MTERYLCKKLEKGAKRELNYKFECWVKRGVSVQRLPSVTSCDMLIGKGRGKVHHRTGHEGPEGE